MVAGPEATLVAASRRDWDRATTSDWAGVLAGLPLFAGVGKRQLRKIAGLAEVRSYSSGESVVEAGDAPDGFYVILGGRAKVKGPPRTRTLASGDYFGEMALLDGEPRSATVVAVGELQAMRLPRRPFLRLVQGEPGIALALLAELARRLRLAEKHVMA
jgi:CRP-like cAMP-binding protein